MESGSFIKSIKEGCTECGECCIEEWDVKTFDDYYMENFMNNKDNREGLENTMLWLRELERRLLRSIRDIKAVKEVIWNDIERIENALTYKDVEVIQQVMLEYRDTKEYVENYLCNPIWEVWTKHEELISVDVKFRR